MSRFYAIGVGPGDPDLLTRKAILLLQQVQVICHAGPQADQGRAWEVIRDRVRSTQQVRTLLDAPMATVSARGWRDHYRPGVEQIIADCRAGRKVAYVAEGDPTLYSTASYVWQLLEELAPDIPVEVVPGVSSVTAAAARVRRPLTRKDETLAIVPANYRPTELDELFESFETVCLLKPKGMLGPIQQAVAHSRAGSEAVYVEEVSTNREWVTKDLAEAARRDAYFALVLVRQRRAKPGPAPVGKLWVVGTGPGDLRLLTPQARAALRQAEVIVGYESYLQLLAGLGLRTEMRGSPIGEEPERAKQALQLAAAGQRVALVSSGDAGVYGMASLLLETAEQVPGVEIEVVPGLTAATAAAALLGAPLGHDFACLSLSNLLTPWEEIERRVTAAGEGDYVLALYNPISQRRTWQLPRACELLLAHRGPGTPVGVVDRAYRPGQRVRLTTLGELAASQGQSVGMETVLIVGNRRTRAIDGRMVTPRGYVARPPVEGGKPAARGSDVGAKVLADSFAIIESELGPTRLPPWAFAVARRMIHASADFDFARILRYSPDFEAAFRTALADGAPLVVDTEMVRQGVRTALADQPRLTLACHLNDPGAAELAESAGLTRSAAAMRLAARAHPSPVVVIGVAPTALEEALRLATAGEWKPRAIIGLPVGFVGVIEAKARLMLQQAVPYLTCEGRKGGSAVASAAVNALVELDQPVPGERGA